MVRYLAPSDYTSMPWKNGGGRTIEIAKHPAAATLAEFAWRVSIADVGSDGPFSRFPGIDRTIVLIEGAGMRLTDGGREVEIRTPFVPYRFSGDDDVGCALIGGSVRDFNAMFRRGAAHGSVEIVRGGNAEIAPNDFVLAYAATGAHDCVIAGNPPRRLDAGHAVLVERYGNAESTPIAVKPSNSGAVALVVSIECP